MLHFTWAIKSSLGQRREQNKFNVTENEDKYV